MHARPLNICCCDSSGWAHLLGVVEFRIQQFSRFVQNVTETGEFRLTVIDRLQHNISGVCTQRLVLSQAHGANIHRPGCAPIPLHREAALLWGLGREASRELPGQEARHIYCPGCRQPLRDKLNGQVTLFFFAAPLYFSANSRGRELSFSQPSSFIWLIFVAKFFRFPQGEFLNLFNFFFDVEVLYI